MTKPMNEIRFWHQVPLKDGRVTPGRIPISSLEGAYLFSGLNFNGMSVLDIGCWDGYFCFMAEQRGAARVVGFDDPDLREDGMDGFEFLHAHFKSNVQFIRGNIFRPLSELFDIVLCYGVLYHVNDPLTAAINTFQLSRNIVIFEGLLYEDANPSLRLIAPLELNNDNSNIYAYSTGWLNMVARQNGFEPVQHMQQNPMRGTMKYRRVTDSIPKYAKRCFSVPPLALT